MAGDKWDLDHKVALINGGRHAEDNLAPALKGPHQAKTRDDVALKAKVARMKAKHLGVWPRGQKIASRGFEKRRTPA